MANKHTPPTRKRGRDIWGYETDRDASAAELARLRRQMEPLRTAMAAECAHFRDQHVAIIKWATKVLKRPQDSQLTLHYCESGVVRAPTAVWCKVVRWPRPKDAACVTPRTYPIPRIAKTKWHVATLQRHAHPAEAALVEDTEFKLAQLRAKVLPLQLECRRLAIQIAMLNRQIARLSGQPVSAPETLRRKRKQGRALLPDMTDVLATVHSGAPQRPQFKHPDGW